MRILYNEQLEKLHNELAGMGRMCEQAISAAMSSLFDSDPDMVKKTQELEKEIDVQERTIESMCMKLILKQQPVATDLRNVSSALKMICAVHLKEMADAASKMVNDSVEAFVNADAEMAKNVILYDNIVDDLFVRIKSEIIEEVVKNSDKGEELFDIMMVTKYLERIGDHACNIAEWVIYSITGSHNIEAIGK